MKRPRKLSGVCHGVLNKTTQLTSLLPPLIRQEPPRRHGQCLKLFDVSPPASIEDVMLLGRPRR